MIAMVLKEELTRYLQDGIAELYGRSLAGEEFVLQPTSAPYQGSHTLLLFPIAQKLPAEVGAIGHALGAWLIKHVGYIEAYEVVSGFLNLSFSDSFWFENLVRAQTRPLHVAQPQTLVIEIACPNTNKPLHLGHLRNSFVGVAVANGFEALGHHVKRVIHINDRGIHICKSMYAYLQEKDPPTPASSGVKGDHLVGRYYVMFEQLYKQEVEQLKATGAASATKGARTPCMLAIQKMLQQWEAGDPQIIQLWKTMNAWVLEGFAATYQALGIAFDKTYYESETYLLGKKIVEEGLEKGVFYKAEDGSVWVDLDAPPGRKLLLRAEGTTVYMTQDLGTADIRASDFKADRSIYVVGNEQDHHFKVLFAILKKLNRPYADKLYHLSYGMVDLPTGKMKSREGTVVDADNLIAEMRVIAEEQTQALGKIADLEAEKAQELYNTLAMGALKFFLLKVNPQKRITFDPQRSVDFHGNTGPFVQYTHARIATMLAMAAKRNISYQHAHTIAPLHEAERRLITHLGHFPELLHEAAGSMNPALIAQYMYALAKLYNQLYTTLPILREQEPLAQQQRLFFSYCTQRTLKQAAGILDIGLPDKM